MGTKGRSEQEGSNKIEEQDSSNKAKINCYGGNKTR